MGVPELSREWTWNCGSYDERAGKWAECHWRTVLCRFAKPHTLLLMDSLFKDSKGDMFQGKCGTEKCLECLMCLVCLADEAC